MFHPLKNPLPCCWCGKKRAKRPDVPCPICKMAAKRSSSPKHKWTPELDTLLRRLYTGARDRAELCANITEFVHRSEIPRYAVLHHAQRVGLTAGVRKPWSQDDLDFLRNYAGIYGVKEIAATLRRSHQSVSHKLKRLSLSQRVTEGYSLVDLAEVLGVTEALLAKWRDLRWFRVRENGRISEGEVRAFVLRRLAHIDLRRVDQPWFKGLLDPHFAMRGFQARTEDPEERMRA